MRLRSAVSFLAILTEEVPPAPYGPVASLSDRQSPGHIPGTLSLSLTPFDEGFCGGKDHNGNICIPSTRRASRQQPQLLQFTEGSRCQTPSAKHFGYVFSLNPPQGLRGTVGVLIFQRGRVAQKDTAG